MTSSAPVFVSMCRSDVWTLLLFGVRCALPRQSMSSAILNDCVRDHAHILLPTQRAQIAQEIEREVALAAWLRSKDEPVVAA